MTEKITTPEALARVLREVDDCLRIEPVGDITVPVADLRILRAAIARPDAPTPTPARRTCFCDRVRNGVTFHTRECDAQTFPVASGTLAPIPAGDDQREALVQAAQAGIAARLSWASMHWGTESVHRDAWPHVASAAVDAVLAARPSAPTEGYDLEQRLGVLIAQYGAQAVQDALLTEPSAPTVTTEQIRDALINVLMSTSNYPRAAQVHMLGKDNGVLLNRATEAVATRLVALGIEVRP